ncbi:hypothetical protein N7492_008744 [Penicillium capsulatum]|uniref:Integral membrane protein TmpA n=1 Tax=Penicillium capsulatum TaxID=69766 RepID=A0A9W9HRA5_9EURO|nr:hypothetical protein N7492_008744 [Penicillium capsulatum]KAJ6106148.1 hypothetical protein N7512_009665 [Penicillium capsulatum]
MADPEKTELALPQPPETAVCSPSDDGPGPALTDPEKAIDSFLTQEVIPSPRDTPSPSDLEAQPTEPKRKRFAHFRYAVFTTYRRLFAFVFIVNLAVFLYFMIANRQLVPLVDATAVNLVVCGLARHPMVVNGIYRVVCSLPRSAPLWLRRRAAKSAHYGGVHSGAGTASLLWYIGFVAVSSQMYWTSTPISTATDLKFSAAPIAVSYVILFLLVVMIAVAHPTIRLKVHDYFELTHRFTSWAILALFVVLLMLFANEVSAAQQQSMGIFLVTLPAFWLLIVAIIAVVHPWLLLRKIAVQPDALSSHAVRLHFNHTEIAFAKGIQVSKHPLRDWHSFAGFPDPVPVGPPQGRGHKRNTSSFSVVVSKAGDWTGDTIKNPPTHLWKRAVLMRGVGYGLRLFHRIIIVTTGSGIGPCLGFLGDENRPLIKVIWQTRTPLKTFGQDVLDLVHKMGPDPVIWDTTRDGRCDMLPLVRHHFKEFNAEAVFVISNPSMVRKVVFDFESQGIPAYGPIFDS